MERAAKRRTIYPDKCQARRYFFFIFFFFFFFYDVTRATVEHVCRPKLIKRAANVRSRELFLPFFPEDGTLSWEYLINDRPHREAKVLKRKFRIRSEMINYPDATANVPRAITAADENIPRPREKKNVLSYHCSRNVSRARAEKCSFTVF